MTWPALVPELYVSNLAESLVFYLDVLGFSVEYERVEEKFVALRLGRAYLMLEEAPSLATATREEFADGQWRTANLERPFGRGMNLEIEVEDLDEIHGRIIQGKILMLFAPNEKTNRIGGDSLTVRRLLVADPDGYLLRFSQSLTVRP